MLSVVDVWKIRTLITVINSSLNRKPLFLRMGSKVLGFKLWAGQGDETVPREAMCVEMKGEILRAIEKQGERESNQGPDKSAPWQDLPRVRKQCHLPHKNTLGVSRKYTRLANMLSDWKYKMMVGVSKWKLNTLENGNRNYVRNEQSIMWKASCMKTPDFHELPCWFMINWVFTIIKRETFWKSN